MRELPAVLDRHELQIELELAAILLLRRGLGGKRLQREHVLQQRIEDGVMGVDDAEGHRRLADDLFARPAINGAETVVDECDSRPKRLYRRRQDGDALSR